MDLKKVYGLMRTWEQTRETEKNMLNKIIEYNQTILEKCRESQKITQESLYQYGVDVEYLLTNIFPYLKKEAAILDHVIKLNKIENGGYEYEVYDLPINGDKDPLKTLTTLNEAVAEVLLYYPQIAQIRTVEQLISELQFK